jgi:hypothetical protein
MLFDNFNEELEDNYTHFEAPDMTKVQIVLDFTPNQMRGLAPQPPKTLTSDNEQQTKLTPSFLNILKAL